MIDTTGMPLHKRGYRRDSNAAPIRETLAAAIAKTSRPREDVLLWDPMCGSGTIAIEAAMIMKNIAPGVNRGFAAESFPFIKREVWRSAREEARDGEVKTAFEAYASDIDPECVALTEKNAKLAGVSEIVRPKLLDCRKIAAPGRRGTIVTNPPYGERLGTLAEVEKLYREIGEHFRSLSPWQVYIITSHPTFERFYGKRADKVRKLYNGMIPCYFYQFFKTEATLKKKYIISEPKAYTQKQFRNIVSKELGGKWVIPMKLPMWIVYAASVVAERIGTLKGKPSTLNRDKFRIMRQRNWNCDVTDAIRDFGFNPQYPLERGVHETVKAYLADKKQSSK